MNNQALQFKRFLEENNAWKQYLDFISSKEMAGAIWHEGSLNGYLNHVHPEKWISEAFIYGNSGSDEVIKFWTRLSVKWFNIVNGKVQAQKLSDFIKTEKGITTFEKDGVRAELNLSSDDVSFFVDINKELVPEEENDSYKNNLEKAMKYFAKVVNELK